MKSTATEIVLVAWYKNCPANDVIRTNSKRDISLNLSNNIQHTKSNKNIICWNRSPHKIWGVNSEKNIINNSRQLANWICKRRPSCDPGLNPENINCAIFHYVVKVKQIENKRMRLLGREPWSSGYGSRLTFQRSWVRIPAPDTGWTFFHIDLL